MSTPSDDAQRDMEQRALRNVRALVDKYEDKDASDQRSVRNLVVGIVVAILVLAAAAYVAFRLTVRDEPTRTLTLPPPANVPR